jgi:putative membrane protein
MGDRISPNNRGFVDFLVSAVVIYFAQFFISNFQATFVGSLIAAAIIGIVDKFVRIKPRIGSPEEVRERSFPILV